MTENSAFREWIQRFLPVAYESSAQLRLEPVTGDAGFRSYYRVNCQPSLLAVNAPPQTEDSLAYVRIAQLLRNGGVHTPEVIAVDFQRGYLLVEDLGRQLLADQLNQQSVDSYYNQAMAVLLQVESIAPPATWLPVYNASRLRDEMALFSQWFVGQLLGCEISAQTRQMLDNTFSVLIDSALDQPQGLVHRDYHSRNLMVMDSGQLGIIDFQDAVSGPLTYDLVSLLKDCYVRWPQSRVERWALDYRARSARLQSVDEGRFLQAFELMGLQRHIKVLGIFSRLWLRDGKPGYLADLPLVFRYTVEAAQRHQSTAPFARWLLDTVEPLLAEHDWYSDWRTAGEQRP